ncbi:zf-HC2 domain-containing protein [Paenibacillus sp. NPDC057967]|uniref:zf-HC2 domain-containing protein n=1 Tax=Paenibacillus sp. NPDC057967 TaxID=3346293 RepID=UPI0036D8166A
MKQNLDNESVCGIVHDLLPLYVERECTPQSHRMVEEHLKTCPACRSLCERMVQESANDTVIMAKFPQGSEKGAYRETDGQEEDGDHGSHIDHGDPGALIGAGLPISPLERDRQAVKIMQRLRRRRVLWVLLLLIVIVPASWLGLNEATGEGLSFRNAYDHYQAMRFIDELEKGNHASAFDYFNMEQEYADLQHDLSLERGLSEAQRAIYEGMTYEAFVAYSKERFVQGMEEFTRLGYRLQREGGIWATRDVVKNPLTGQRNTIYSYQIDIRLTDKHGTEQSGRMSLITYPYSDVPHSFRIGGYLGLDEGNLIGVLAQKMDYWDWG